MKKVLFPIAIILTLLFLFSHQYKNNRTENSQSMLKNDSDSFEFTFETEAINLPPKPEDLIYAREEFYPSINTLTTKQDLYITQIYPEVENGPAEILHHGAVYFDGIKDEYCVDGNKIFFSASKELTPVNVPQGYAYIIPKGTTLTSNNQYIHFRNDTDRGYQNVKYKIHIKGTTSKNNNLTPLNVFWLNVECSIFNEYIFPVPANKELETSLNTKYKADKDFKMFAISGHVHDFGNKMEFIVNDEVIWTFYPVLEDEKIVSIPINYPKDPIEIKKGNVLDIKVYYDNPTNHVSEGMGMFSALTNK